MKPALLILAATIVVAAIAGVYDFHGRLVDDVQKAASVVSGPFFYSLEQSSQELHRWSPDDSIAGLMSWFPVGIILAIGLCATFWWFAMDEFNMNRIDRSITVILVSSVGIVGVAAIVFGDIERVKDFTQAHVALMEWSTAKDAASQVLMKDGFLHDLLLLKRHSLLMRGGMIGVGLALMCVILLSGLWTGPITSAGLSETLEPQKKLEADSN